MDKEEYKYIFVNTHKETKTNSELAVFQCGINNVKVNYLSSVRNREC